MEARPEPSIKRPVAYVAVGLLVGLGYALLNAQTDDWARSDWAQGVGRGFFAFHAFVDRGIPLLAGGLVGLAFHWGHLRARLARAESMRADDLRSRLGHVERDQAVWLVAASTLHELKNPLHALGLLVDELEIVAKSGDPESTAAHVASVRTQLDRTLVPLDALRRLARREPQEHRLRPIGSAIETLVASLRPWASEAGVDLRVDGDLAAPTEVDPELLRIIVDNLVANAVEGTEGAGSAKHVRVRVLSDAAHESVTVRVSDDGPGVPEDRKGTVFEPLRSDKTRGLGLGLPLARAVARSLGGELFASAEAGFATSFDLVIPAKAKP